MTCDYAVLVTPGGERDLGLVISSWLDSSRPHYVSISAWKRAMRDGILASVQAHRVLVASAPEDRDHLYGWACADGDRLLYVYVRPTRRRAGLGRLLIEGLARYARGPRSGELWARRRGLVPEGRGKDAEG